MVMLCTNSHLLLLPPPYSFSFRGTSRCTDKTLIHLSDAPRIIFFPNKPKLLSTSSNRKRWLCRVVSEEQPQTGVTDSFKLTYLEVTYLEPGQNSEVEGEIGTKVKVRATAGPILGPPWQRPENGYLITSPQAQMTLYYEPHCVYNKEFLQKHQADIVITPVIKQLLPKFTLVSGQEDAVELVQLLQAKFVVPMRNGDLDSKGLLSSIVKSEGTMESFKELLSKEIPNAQVLEPSAGVPLEILAPPTI